jgi:ATP-dependent RNA helicase RhlE
MDPKNSGAFQFLPIIAAGVKAAGYDVPTPIQAQTIPLIQNGKDVIALAPDGKGKTVALVLAILQRLLPGQRGFARAVIISPAAGTVEKTCDVISRLGNKAGIQCTAIYGEGNAAFQAKELKRKPEIIVGCPDRILNSLWKGKLNLSELEILAIDDGDRMFSLGFWPDIFNILACRVNRCQTLLFSATMPENLRRLTRQFLSDPVTVTADTSLPVKALPKPAVSAPQVLKTAMLKGIAGKIKTDAILVFTRTRQSAERVAKQVTTSGYQVLALQGKLSKYQKSAAFKGLPAGAVIILVVFGTPTMGADVSSIFRLINDRKQGDAAAHVGSTGRLDKNGDTLTLVTRANAVNIHALEQLLEAPLIQFPL